MKLNIYSGISAIIVAMVFSSCGDKKAASKAPSGDGTPPTQLSSLVTDSAPEGALSVVAARVEAKPDSEITLRGKVGGRTSPISEAAALLVLADETAIKSCDEIEGDDCEAPWDYCCEDPAKIAASTATIQVRGEDGKLLRSTLRGLGGLKELSRLVVTGTVDAASNSENLIVNATKIHVAKP